MISREHWLRWRRDLTHVLSTSCFQHCLKPCKTCLWGTGSTDTNKKIKPFLALVWVSTADVIHSSPFCTAPGLCLFPVLDLLSQGIIPRGLLSIPGFGSGHHCSPPFSGQPFQKADCCSRHFEESDQNEAPPACRICLTMQGQVPLLAHWHLVINAFPFTVSGLVLVVDVNSWHCPFT